MNRLIINRPDIIKWVITIILSGIFLVIPEQGLYTSQVKYFLAITVFGLALAAFEIVHIMFISALMPGLWFLFKVAPAETIMAPWIGNTFLMIIGVLFMAATLEASGLLDRIAYHLMCKIKGNYYALLFCIFGTGIVLNVLSSGNGYFILAPLAAGLFMSLGGKDSKLGAGLASAVMIGGCTSHAYTYQASAWAVITKMGEKYIAPNDITPLGIMVHNWPLFVISAIILLIIAKWYKPGQGFTETSYFQEKLSAMGKMTRREKVNALMLALLLVYVFTVDIHKFHVNYGFMLIPWMVFLPGLDGADSDTMRRFNFPILFFVAACMSIGTIASNLGFGQLIASETQRILQGSTNPIAIMGIIFAIVFVLNFFMTPLAIFALTIVPICILAVNAGHSPIPFAYAVNACSEAIILPYEYVPYLIVFSFGMISMKDFIKTNILRSVIFFGGFLFILVPYWMLIGLL